MASSRNQPPCAAKGRSVSGLCQPVRWVLRDFHLNIDSLLGMNGEHSSGTAEAFIGTAEVNALDT